MRARSVWRRLGQAEIGAKYTQELCSKTIKHLSSLGNPHLWISSRDSISGVPCARAYHRRVFGNQRSLGRWIEWQLGLTLSHQFVCFLVALASAYGFTQRDPLSFVNVFGVEFREPTDRANAHYFLLYLLQLSHTTPLSQLWTPYTTRLHLTHIGSSTHSIFRSSQSFLKSSFSPTYIQKSVEI